MGFPLYTGYPLERENTGQGKQGKCKKEFPVRENTGNLEILPKHREFGFAQVENSLILKVKDVSIFATKISILGGKLDKSVKSVSCM